MSPTTTANRQPFRLTNLRSAILEELARHEILTVDLLVSLLDGAISDEKHLNTRLASMRRSLRSLLRDGYIHSLSFRPDDYQDLGTLPSAFWLSDLGAAWTRNQFPATDPRPYPASRSPHNIPHDIVRTETRIAIYEMCAEAGSALGWKKTDLERIIQNIRIKPDDLFEITNGKTYHYFLEEERRKKNLESLYAKFKPYVDLWGSQKFKDSWGFKYFTVIVPMRDEDARQSLLVHFAGDCNCLDPQAKRIHAKSPYKLDTDILWITTHDLITKSPNGQIFQTPKDYLKAAYSFLSSTDA